MQPSRAFGHRELGTILVCAGNIHRVSTDNEQLANVNVLYVLRRVRSFGIQERLIRVLDHDSLVDTGIDDVDNGIILRIRVNVGAFPVFDAHDVTLVDIVLKG